MKILFLVDALGKGGSERRMLELVRHLSGNTTHQISLICLTDFIEYPDVYKLPINFQVLPRTSKKDPAVFLRLYKLIKQQRPDIIHSWSSMANIYSLPIAKLLGIKFITSVIADSPNNLSLRNKAYLRAKLVFPFADKITSNSIAGLKAYKAPGKKSLCIYNGFDDKRLGSLMDKEALKTKLGINGKLIVGMVAGFNDRKDYQTLVKAAEQVIELEQQVVFVLIGDGALRKKIMETVPAQVKDKILFTGNVHNAESYINAFDIAVLCTNTLVHQEGISNAILEYMALAKPVIATSGGGTNEIVVDEKTGFLINPFDPSALAGKIIQLIKEPDLRTSFGRNGLQRIKDSFSIEKMCSRFYALYDEVGGQKAGLPTKP